MEKNSRNYFSAIHIQVLNNWQAFDNRKNAMTNICCIRVLKIKQIITSVCLRMFALVSVGFFVFFLVFFIFFFSIPFLRMRCLPFLSITDVYRFDAIWFQTNEQKFQAYSFYLSFDSNWFALNVLPVSVSPDIKNKSFMWSLFLQSVCSLHNRWQ